MSHFYGVAKGSRGEGARTGDKTSGLATTAASWAGSIQVELTHDRLTGKDRFTVWQQPWYGRGVREKLAEGIVGEHTQLYRVTEAIEPEAL